MNGAESLVATLAANEVSLCFANPGTSEMHFVAALDRIDGVRCVLGLFEGVVTGAADGYYRMAGKPAATLLHLGPGLGNGIANLHNAKKARSGIVNIVGDHASAHARFESPLQSDVQAIAAPVSHWVRSSRSSMLVAADGAQAVAATRHGAVGQIATLILPADTAWGPGANAAAAAFAPPLAPPQPLAVMAAAHALHAAGSQGVLLLGAAGMQQGAVQLAAAIAHKTGCRVIGEFYNARVPAGRSRQRVERIPYSVDAAVAQLAGTALMVLAGSSPPIGFFAYPGKPDELAPPGCAMLTLVRAEDDVPAGLLALADALDARPMHGGADAAAAPGPGLPHGTLTPELAGAVLAACLPEDAIVVDEAISTGRSFGGQFAHAAPHDWLSVMGGAIGFGLPGALGAAIAAPGRPVLALVGDGSAMYTLQALWSMARESLPVVSVIFANRAYRILQGELAGVGARISGPKAQAMLTLDRPALDWLALAQGMGVPGARVDTVQALAQALARGFASRGPYLIEAVL